MIGVFDSGFGGLTVHRALTKALPDIDFTYLGDNKNAPYATRPPIDVLTLTCVGVDRLFAQGCDLVVVACNTASTVALRWIQQQWLPAQSRADGVRRNVLGVVVPTIEAALADIPDSGSIAIFATERTIYTETYPAEIQKRREGLHLYQQACPMLVPLIEGGAPADHIRAATHRYVGELHQQMGKSWPDRVILGCTHYPIIAPYFAEALPSGTIIIDQPDATATALTEYLNQHPDYRQSGTGRHQFLSTGYAPEAQPLIEQFWGSAIEFQKI